MTKACMYGGGQTKRIHMNLALFHHQHIHMPSLTLAASFPQVGEVLIKKKNWDSTMKTKQRTTVKIRQIV